MHFDTILSGPLEAPELTEMLRVCNPSAAGLDFPAKPQLTKELLLPLKRWTERILTCRRRPIPFDVQSVTKRGKCHLLWSNPSSATFPNVCPTVMTHTEDSFPPHCREPWDSAKRRRRKAIARHNYLFKLQKAISS